jgi:hypothetical protein
LNNNCGFDSGEGIMVISGMGGILEGKDMLDMDMLCHQIRTQACTLQLQLPGCLNLGVGYDEEEDDDNDDEQLVI